MSTSFEAFFFSLLIHLVPLGKQLRNKLNQDQNSKLQQQRESLNKRNLEVASMDKRISELRDRLWKKKAALQQKENLPVSSVTHINIKKTFKQPDKEPLSHLL